MRIHNTYIHTLMRAHTHTHTHTHTYTYHKVVRIQYFAIHC